MVSNQLKREGTIFDCTFPYSILSYFLENRLGFWIWAVWVIAYMTDNTQEKSIHQMAFGIISPSGLIGVIHKVNF